MGVVLDTTVQIGRIFGTKERKASIRDAIGHNECYSTVYVFGEYCSNILNDYVTMHSIIDVYDNLNEAEKKINENAFGRAKDRMHKLFIFLRERYDNDIDDIKLSFKANLSILRHKFHKDLCMPLLDGAKCNRANFSVEYPEGRPVVKNIHCRQTDKHCDISSLWQKYFALVETLGDRTDIDERIRSFMSTATALTPPKGNNCKNFGDCIICLEAINGNMNMICTSNVKDFEPLSKHLGLKLIIPDYKHK